jgi:anti-sigma factor RsiW
VKARVLHLDSDEHGAVQAVLPWYANGTLDAAERAEVEAHLGDCARCRADLEFQRHLRATPAREALPGEIDRGWLALRAQIEAPAAEPARPTPAHDRRSTPRWWPLALGLQAAFVVVLMVASAWLFLPRPDAYRTLGAAAAPPAANALVVFRPDATEAEMRRALRAADARVVGGPTVTDAYLLRIPALGADSLARLRAEPAVTRVESLEGEPAR